MPPLWGLGLWLIHVSTQMPSLWDSRGFLGYNSLCSDPVRLGNRTYRAWGNTKLTAPVNRQGNRKLPV